MQKPKLKGKSRAEIMKARDNMMVECASCHQEVKAKDAAHARTQKELPNYICHNCLRKQGILNQANEI